MHPPEKDITALVSSAWGSVGHTNGHRGAKDQSRRKSEWS